MMTDKEPQGAAVSTFTVTGTYEQCPHCKAPLLSPMPEGWTVSLERSSAGVRIMPHRAECAR